MRITFLLTQDLSSPSGLGRYFPWAKELVKLGHDVRVIALHPDFKRIKARRMLQEGVTVEYVAQMHVKKSGSTKTYFSPFQLAWIVFLGTLKLAAAAVTAPTDVLMIGKPHPMNSIAGLIVKLLKSHTRIILDIDDYEAGSNRFQSAWQKRIIAWFEKTIPRLAQTVTCNTFFNIQRLKNLGISSDKLVYLPNGIDPDRFQQPDPDEVHKLRKLLNLVDHRVIAYIGSMSLTNHAVDLLLRAFVTVRASIPDARLILVGGGEDLEKLKKLSRELEVEDAVVFTGRVDPSQISLYYAISDISVDPVYDDDAARGRCPLKMFESWACGVPFVTAAVGDRETLSGDPQAALLVKPGDEYSLAACLQEVLVDSRLQQQISAAGLDRVKHFTWETITDQTANDLWMQHPISEK